MVPRRNCACHTERASNDQESVFRSQSARHDLLSCVGYARACRPERLNAPVTESG
jgi:hypothetical protein